MNINVNSLVIEVGRQCNMCCDHCLRGAAENITMPLDLAFKAIDTFDSISQITFTGGEPMLYAENIIKIIDYIIENRKDVYGFYMATNGKEVSMPLMLKFAELYAYCVNLAGDDDYCRVDMSTDFYHEGFDINPILKAFKFFGTRNNVSSLINEGNAELYGIGNKNLRKENNFSVSSWSDTVDVEMVYVNAKGYIFSDCDYSYKTQEELAKYTLDDIPFLVKEFAEDVA